MTVSTTIFLTVAIVSVPGSALGLLGGLLPPLSPPSAPGSGGSGGPLPIAGPGDTSDAGGTGGTNSDGGSVWGDGGGAGGVSPASVPLSLAAAAQRAVALEPSNEVLWDLSIDENADALRRAALKVQEELRLEDLIASVSAAPDPLDTDEAAASSEAVASAYRQTEPQAHARSARI